MMSEMGTILTIGHSNLSYEQFLQLLRGTGVTAVADVRSVPSSRRHPHFNRKALKEELRADGIAYVFLGEELGGRPKDRRFFCEGVADYEQMARVPAFNKGIQRVIEGATRYRIALMCSEHDPLDCHRCLLIGRVLHEQGLTVSHILSNGRQKSQAQIEEELLAMARQENRADFFPDDQRAAAYRQHSRKVAFSNIGRPTPDLIAAE
jgi:uncharacterized protein (DUF488 family)